MKEPSMISFTFQNSFKEGDSWPQHRMVGYVDEKTHEEMYNEFMKLAEKFGFKPIFMSGDEYLDNIFSQEWEKR